jgi:hypothetical protein
MNTSVKAYGEFEPNAVVIGSRTIGSRSIASYV